ncbi:hypothetical protein HDU76_004360 [Blyttiomyces sp. JEL0837]|nr:hypothetical protein HDU76_004360 [Blyttiomyces sp. JEL0837]
MPRDPVSIDDPAKALRGGGRYLGFTSFMDAINKETIKKEMKYFKIHDSYVAPRIKKNYVLTDKPNNIVLSQLVKETNLSEGRNKEAAAAAAAASPQRVHEQWRSHYSINNHTSKPTRTSEEYGWYPVPLMKTTCPLFHHPRVVTEITLLYGPVTKKQGEGEGGGGNGNGNGNGGGTGSAKK